jgi:hypothetical protein
MLKLARFFLCHSFLPQLRNATLQPMKNKVSAVADDPQRDPQQFFCRNARLTTSVSKTTRQTLKPLQQ